MIESSKVFSFIREIDTSRDILLDSKPKMISRTQIHSFIIFWDEVRFELSYWELVTKYKINRFESSDQLHLLSRSQQEQQKQQRQLLAFIKMMLDNHSSEGLALNIIKLAEYLDIPSSNIEAWFSDSDLKLDVSKDNIINFQINEFYVGVIVHNWKKLLMWFCPDYNTNLKLYE